IWSPAVSGTAQNSENSPAPIDYGKDTEVLYPEQPVVGPGPVPSDNINIFLRNRIFDPLLDPPLALYSVNTALLAEEPSEYKLLQFSGPVQKSWREDVESEGVELIQYIPDYTFIAKIPQDKTNLLQDMTSVRWLGPFHPYYKIEPQLLTALQFNSSVQEQLLGPYANYTVALLNPTPETITEFKTELSKLEVKILSKDFDFALEFGLSEIQLNLEQLNSLSQYPTLAWIQPSAELVTHMPKSSRILGARQETDGPYKADGTAMWSYDPSTGNFIGYPGSNATIAVVDTGVDGTHPAFDGRKVWFKAYNWAGNWQDAAYHGTHVAGISLGNGKWRPGDPTGGGAAGKYAGVAPNASLIGQAYLGSGSSVATVMYDAATHGADISTNSWGFYGSYYYGVYESVCAAYDRFVRDSGDGIPVSVTFSAGNDGPGSGTVSPPATAKNIICVGSTDDNTGNSVSGFSARGPLEDGRLSPDLLTPGAQVTSALANSAYSYAAFSGTSMAAPAAAGGMAVVINYYQDNYGYTPSPALVKAILLNGAEPMPGLNWPDNNQGWGRMNLPNSLLETQSKKFLYYDQQDLLETGEEVTYEFNVAEESNLKIHLVYTDDDGSPNAAKALVNDLDLLVISPSGDSYFGNQFYLGQSIPGGSPDNTNNVEGFQMKNPTIGVWRVTIKGKNVPSGPQDFALFISGPVWEDMLDIKAFDLFSDKGEQVFEGEQVQLNASILNTGTLNFAGGQYVLMDYCPDGTSKKLLVGTISDSIAGEFFNFTIDWGASQVGTHRLVLSLDPLDSFEEANETNNVFEMYVYVHTFGVNLVNPEPDSTITPGIPAEFILQVHNTGTTADTYNLSILTRPNGWTAELNTSKVTVPVSSYRNITLQLSVPICACAGLVDGLEVMAQSSIAPSFYSRQAVPVKIAELNTFSLIDTLLEKPIEPGGSTVYNIEVKNTGNTDLFLAVKTGKLSQGWKLKLSAEKILVPYAASSNFSVELTSPGFSLAGYVESVPVTLELAMKGGGSQTPSDGSQTCTLNATVSQYYDFELELDTTNMDVTAGKRKRIEFEVHNNGNGFDTFTFDAIPPANWAFGFEPERITVEGGSSAAIRLDIDVPVNEYAGTYELAVKSKSGGNPELIRGFMLTLNLMQKYDIKLTAEKSAIVVTVGGTMVLPLYLVNNGNGNDTVTLKANWFEGLVMFTEKHLVVPMHQSVTTNAIIHIPENFKPSEQLFDIVATSGDNTTYVSTDITAIITAPYNQSALQTQQPDTEDQDTAGDSVGEEEDGYGLFKQGLFFDIFVFILMILLIVIILFMGTVMASSEKKRRGEPKVGRVGMPEAAITDAELVPDEKPEPAVDMGLMEGQVIDAEVMALPEAGVTEQEAGEAEPVEAEVVAEEPLDEDSEQLEPSRKSKKVKRKGGGGSRPSNSLLSVLLIIFIVIATFGSMISFDIGTEPAQGLTVKGNIFNDTVWSENITLTAHTTVRAGATLYIQPGVNVYFQSGVRLYISGTLYANGTKSQLINFTSSSNNPWKGIWNRIQFNGSGRGRMNYCNVSYATYGLYFYGGDYVSIENSTFSTNRYGVYMRSNSNYNRFINNTMKKNGWGYGIFISYCKFNYYENNSLSDNTYNFYITGNNKDYFTHYFKNDTNTAQGKPMYYWLNRKDEQVPVDAGFVALVGCTNMTVRDMVIKKSGEGIIFAYTNVSRIDNVTVQNNNYGIYFYQAGEGNLITNVTSKSNSYGLYFHYAYYNKLRNNNFRDNTYNVYFVGSILKYFEHDIDTSNKVQDNKPMIYYVDRHHETVPTNAGFVALVDCTNMTVADVSIRKNAQGILVAHSENIKLENVYLWKNNYATYFYRTTGTVTLGNSTIYDNRCGAYTYQADNNVIYGTQYDSNYDAFIIRDTHEMQVTNCSIIAANRWNVDLATTSTVTLLNTTFNPNKIKIANANTELTVKWYMHVVAIDDLGAPAKCHVIVTDGKSNVVADRDIVGSLKYIICIGYQQVPGKIFYEYNNYTVDTRNQTSGIVRDINMTYSRTVKFVFNSRPQGILPEWLEFEEDGWLELDLTDYFSDYNELTYQTYVYPHLEVSLNNFYQTANITSEPDWCGSEKITIRIIDEHGAYIESTARVNVTSVNDVPIFTRTVPNIHMIEGQTSYKFDLAGYFSDADNLCSPAQDTLKWYIEGEDSRYLQVKGENSTSTEMEIVILDTDFFG
ncbi:MAG: S8 family serine peptidase, partial [Thermoplasmata archaeon]